MTISGPTKTFGFINEYTAWIVSDETFQNALLVGNNIEISYQSTLTMQKYQKETIKTFKLDQIKIKYKFISLSALFQKVLNYKTREN